MHVHTQWETPAAVTQQEASALSRATEESHPGRRVCNDTNSLPSANGGTRPPAARASISIMAKCAQTPRRRWVAENRLVTQRGLPPQLQPSVVATETRAERRRDGSSLAEEKE